MSIDLECSGCGHRWIGAEPICVAGLPPTSRPCPNCDSWGDHRYAAEQRKKETLRQEALKFDERKLPLDLLPFEALEKIAEVLEHGAIKYAAHNWRKGIKWSRLIAALFRHLFQFARGENIDPDSGLTHLAHAGCCLLFLLSYQTLEQGEDDRFKVQPPAPL